MIRPYYLSFVLLIFAGHAIAQVAPPAAVGQAAPQGPGRGVPPAVVTGPSAPVPPEVAMPRPTPEELVKVNDALRSWIASDKSSAKPLLDKYQSLLIHQPPRLNVAAKYT